MDEDLKELTRTERKKEQTRRKIIDVGMRLIRENGFDQTTMERIACEADIAKGTLYSYFPEKEALISAYIKLSFQSKNEERMQRYAKMPDTRTRMAALFTELLQGIRAYPEIFEKYMVYRMRQMVSFRQEEEQKSGLYLLVLKIIELGLRDGELRGDIPVPVLEDMLEFAFIEAVKRLHAGGETDTEAVAESCISLFLYGAGAKDKNI